MAFDLFTISILSSALATFLVGAGFVWLVSFRRSVVRALEENARQQIDLAKQVGDTLTQIQKQQSTCEQYVQRVAEAHLALKQDFTSVITRLEKTATDQPDSANPRILH